MKKDSVVQTEAGCVLLTKSRSAAAAFTEKGGCVIGLCPEKELRTVNFPEAAVLTAEESADELSESFIRKTACHFYGVPFTVAVTPRLVIRESTAADYEAVFALLRDCEKEGSHQYRIFADGFDLNEIGSKERFCRYVNACYRFFGFGIWTVLAKDYPDDRADMRTEDCLPQKPVAGENVIGWCGLFPKQDEGEAGFHIELGYAIAPAFQNKGYGYEACAAILGYAGSELEIEKEKIVVRADSRNAAALGLADKLGLTVQTI